MKVSQVMNAKACKPAATRRHAESRSHGVKCAASHTAVAHQARCGQNATGENNRPQLRKKIKIGTWNIQSMIHAEKKRDHRQRAAILPAADSGNNGVSHQGIKILHNTKWLYGVLL